MNIDPDVKLNYVDFLMLQALERIEHKLNHIQEKQNSMAIQLDNLIVEVTEMSSTVDSVIVLLETLHAELVRIQEQMVEPELLQPLVDMLDQKQKALADAIVANTPAAEE
jgi:hypothetical protein